MRRLRACFSAESGKSPEEPPMPPLYTPPATMNYVDLYAFLYEHFTEHAHVLVNDRDYGVITRELVEDFLRTDHTDSLQYAAESFDCDDFALVTAGRFRLWFRRRCPGLGCAFGFISGDLRPARAPDTPRMHAMCCFIDNERRIWILEPQNDAIMQLADTSRVRFVLI
jgi:hypothetical protein